MRYHSCKFVVPVALAAFVALSLTSCLEEKPADAPAPAEEPSESPADKPAESPAEKADKPAEEKPEPAEAPAAKPSEAGVADPGKKPDAAKDYAPMKKEESANPNIEIATLGGGCFWCTEAVYERIKGVTDVVSGYMGGHVENPTYEQVCTKTTGHAEVIQVHFDKTVISFDEILEIFWDAHDPTTLNMQGNDRGPQYRSAIFYHSPEQKNIAVQSIAKLDQSGKYDDPAVTEVTEASKFWEAEDYHQDYYRLNKDKNPYCRVVITPKMKKFGFE